MAHSSSPAATVVPVEGLTGQLAGVWSGWEGLGDREIVREASAKGLHLKLAHKFLERRRHCSHQEAKEYFASEVDIWVSGLLNKKMIHRASHILNNVGKVPADYIRATCLKCKEPSLRDYLAQHVESSLNDEERQAWQLVKLLAKHEEKLGLRNELISHKCLEEIIQLPPGVRDALFTELYFYTREPTAVAYLKTDVVWSYLLTNNRLDLIKLWIDVAFGRAIGNAFNDGVGALFEHWNITDEMVAAVESSHGMRHVNDLVLGHLSRYGVFSAKECSDSKLILARLFGECTTRSDITGILSKASCNVDREKFFSELDVVEFSRNYGEDAESRKMNAKAKGLYDCLTAVCSANGDYEDFLELGIVETVGYLCDDPVRFFDQNPIVLFALVFLRYFKLKRLSKDTTLDDVLRNEEGLVVRSLTLSREVLDSIVVRLPYLKLEVGRRLPENEVSMYQLVDGCGKLNATVFFKWRSKNAAMPTFQSEHLVKKFGHREKLSYVNFLKEARPGMAASVFYHDQEKLFGSVSSKAKSRASLCAHVFALRHSKNLEIVSGCVSFLEILGVNSENLRLHVTVAQIVENHLGVCIEKLLESIVYNNEKDLRLVLSYLERSFDSHLNAETIEDKDRFFQALRTWDLVVRFAGAHNTSLPTSLLKFLARHDCWFEFVLVGQIFAYPAHQMIDCAQFFDNASLREHLLLALSNSRLGNSSSECQNSREDKVLKKAARPTLSNEISGERGRLSRPSLPQLFDPSTKQSGTTNPSLITDDSALADDLWLVILKCHDSPDPPGALLKASQTYKSPILTVLATFYEPSSISSYCYSWLVVSVESADFARQYNECLDNQIWTASEVSSLFLGMVSRGSVGALHRGFQIFLPENPLRLFFQFLEQCLEYGHFRDFTCLTDFATACSNYKCNRLINWECSDATYLENACWIQTIAVKCILAALDGASRSTRAQMELLGALIECHFRDKLIVDSPDFESLLEYTRILSETRVRLNYHCFDTTDKVNESEVEVEKCANELIDAEDYGSALELSKAAGLRTSKIILAQYRGEFKRQADRDGAVDPRFWSQCSGDFVKYEVCRERAVEFFVEHAEKAKSHRERYEILRLAFELLEANPRERRSRDTVEMAMWKSCILAGPENIEITARTGVFGNLRTELLSSIGKLRATCSLTEPQEKLAVEALIERLLDAGRLETALRIGAIFNCRNRELQVLMLCLSLAEGEISPYHLTSQQRSLITEPNGHPRQKNNTLRSIGRLPRMPSSSSLSLSSSTNLSKVASAALVMEQQEQLDCLALLTNLVATLNHGVDIGIRILLCYRLALQLGKRYHVLLTLSNPMQLLRETVSGPSDRRLEIARDIITAYQIENESIANFLSEEIVAHITQVIEDNLNEPTNAWNYNMNLQSVIELCKDTSLLGLKLLGMAHKLLGNSNGEKRNLVTLKIIVELLIRSHDCFTAACNMEGIASVLRKCQQLAHSLQNLKHWSLLVRLVTGVGRFTEMNYIFQILKEHDHFEFLLGRGLVNVPGLRMALLDFLKRNCPDNKDLFNIVALHFRLYNEIALTWENEAKGVISDLVKEAKRECGRNASNPRVEIKLVRNDATDKKLQLAITNLTHATQYFLQDNKLNLASRCSHQAQLVALQISLLMGVHPSQHFPCLLNLTCDEVNRAICRYLNFTQALIIARAYNVHVDWASAIYSHYLLSNETKYFRDFVTSKLLTASVAVDCARKFRLEKSITLVMAENMRALVDKLGDVECKYVLASQLGFRSIVEQMLDDPAVEAYLKDTVFKRGFVASEFVG
ncbi:spatacsin [Copidosoma floridanum]|uniref:spatacsin n=1 Tax=Copidosoma floridanum TaxID=29053 RepID=UPI0006C9CDBB|nr:spatacsin [Copidosoma floridanum]